MPCAYVVGCDLGLEPKEFAILALFAEHAGKLLSTQFIHKNVWDTPFNDYDKTLRKHISNLRQKLLARGASHNITNIRGKGYRFDENDAEIWGALSP